MLWWQFTVTTTRWLQQPTVQVLLLLLSSAAAAVTPVLACRRRDAEGSWSQKHGDTFVTNTFPNGSIVWDVEDPAILGAYSSFCGYFHVDPATHAETDSSWTYSSVPKRLQQAKDMGYAVSSVPLTQPSSAWMRLK